VANGLNESTTRGGFGVVGLGVRPNGPMKRKRVELCAEMGHPGCTYNVALERTWCLCGEVQTEGDTSVPHIACCGGPLEETVQTSHSVPPESVAEKV
jgi:hypothetical protein